MAFNFPVREGMTFADFLELPTNAAALRAVAEFPAAHGEVLCLYGEAGSGKTHLLHAWASGAHVDKMAGPVLVCSAADLPKTPEAFGDFLKEGAPLFLAVDDLESLLTTDKTSSLALQEMLFFLFNHVKNTGGALLAASQIPVGRLKLIPELSSRLLTGRQIEMLPVPDNFLELLLVKWLQERQLTVEPAVVRYLLAHAERSVEALRRVVAQLDRLSLEQKRKITVPLVKSVVI